MFSSYSRFFIKWIEQHRFPFGTYSLLKINICFLASCDTLIILFVEPQTKQYPWVEIILWRGIFIYSHSTVWLESFTLKVYDGSIFLWRKWYYGIEWSFSGNEYRIQSDKQFSDLSGERDDCDKSSSCGSFEGFSKPEVLGIGTSSSVFTFLFFLYIIKWHLLHNISTITITFFKAFDHFSASSSLFTLSLCLDDFQNEELHPTHRECQALILKLYTYLLNVLKIY